MKIEVFRDLVITTLTENSANAFYLGQWGLSFLLEMVDGKGSRRKVIFDTGIDKRALLQNIRKMKKNLSDVDCVVLSHRHDDHTASTVEIVKAAGGVKVYAHPHTFSPRFHEDRTGKRRQIGVPTGEHMHEIEKAGGKVVLSPKPVEVVSVVWTTGQIGRATSFESPLPLTEGGKLIIIHDGKEMNDDILDDQALWMKVDEVGPYVITGCAHAGTINTLLHVRKIGNFREIRGLVGGTHLVGRSDEYVEQTIAQLKQFALRLISPCHCTAFKAMARLWKEFPEAFV